VTDIDGNVYTTIKISSQWWMAENLKVTHYRNGDSIPNVIDSSAWMGLNTGAYCNYDNDTSHVAVYGRLYNWYTVNNNRNIAPTGWHLPTDAEWQTLIDYLGGELFAGGKMKEAGTAHWVSPNMGATNESGFSALPGGHRYLNGQANGYCYSMGYFACFWSSTYIDGEGAWFRNLAFDYSEVLRCGTYLQDGLSIRCVKD